MYIITNSNGLLMGVYTKKDFAFEAIKHYNRSADTNTPSLFLFRASEEKINKLIANRFYCIWASPDKF